MIPEPHLARDRVVVAAASGDINAAELGALIDKVLGGLNSFSQNSTN